MGAGNPQGRRSCPVLLEQTGILLAVLVQLLTSSGVSAGPVAGGLLPVPADEAQREATGLVREVYGDALTQAGTPAEKVQLAGRLLDESNQAVEPANRYALLAEARRLAVEAGDLQTAFAAIEQMTEIFDVDPVRIQASTLWQLSAKTKDREVYTAIAMKAQELADAAVQQGQFDLAQKLVDFAVENARSARDGKLVHAIVAHGETIAPLREQYDEVQRALATLETKPLDPAANREAGRWRCLVQDRWDEGVPMLVLGDDAALSDLAKRDLLSPQTATERLAVADGWWQFAAQCDEQLAARVKRRAGLWYARALPALTGLDQQRAQVRLQEAGPVATMVPEETRALSLEDLALLMTFDRGTFFYKDNTPYVRDLSGRGNHGTVANLDFAPGVVGDAGSFNGENSAVFVPQVATDDFTISFWVKTAGSRHTGSQWHAGAGLVDGETPWIVDDLGVSLTGTTIAFGIGRPDTTVRSSTHVADDRWHHCCATRHLESGRIVLYIDGRPEATTVASTRPLRSPPKLAIGQIQTGKHPFRGLMDELAIFQRCLTHEEVQALHALGMEKTSLAAYLHLADRQTEPAIEPEAAEDAPASPVATGRYVLSGPNVVKLTEQRPVRARVGWDGFWVNRAPGESWPLIGPDFEYCREFLYAHAPSRLAYVLPRGMLSFTAVGYCVCSRSVRFLVVADGTTIFESPKAGIVDIRVDLPPRTKVLELVVDDIGDKGRDQSFWCLPTLHRLKIEDLEEKRGASVSMTTLPPAAASVGSGKLWINRMERPDQPIPVLYRGGGRCDEFFYAHPESEAVFDLPQGADRFMAVGYAMLGQSVMFRVLVDGRLMHESPKAGIVPIDVAIPEGAKQLTLETDPLGSGFRDHAFWCYPRLRVRQ